MLTCINKNSVEYLSLKNRANIPESILNAVCRDYLDRFLRFPYLDELPNADSSKALYKTLNIKSNGSARILDILNNTGKKTIEDAIIEINNLYRDLETNIIPIVKDAIVDITHRPVNNNEDSIPVILDTHVNDFMVFNTVLSKLASLYGIKFNSIDSQELGTEQWLNIMPEGSFVNGFIYNGEIYINTDRISVDAPLHEIMHLLIGNLRFKDPTTYLELINSVENWENYPNLVLQFPNRSRNDINEEIFVTEVSKFLLKLPCNLSGINDKLKHEIYYNVSRMLDSILMGLDSVKTIDSSKLFNMSLKEVASVINSELMINNFKGTFNAKNSELHRKLNNIKRELINNNDLKLECD